MVPNDYTEDDDLALCYNLQAEEWEVLQSIHPTICISKSDTAVRLEIPVELDVERTVDVIPVPHHTTVTDPMSVPLSCLPPLLLDITLPPLYPTHSPALIVAVRAAAGWVPGRVMEEMVTWMTETWTDMGGNVSSGGGTGVLYTWVEWIRSGEFLTSVGLCSEDGHIRRVSRSRRRRG
ncbi:hypothetical protein ID866_5019 [Astraeus odoratus]|nr:hypothetical protein ID866_5019 [Astraeus odoratus]